MSALSVSPVVSLSIPTSEGEFITHYSPNGLAELHFPSNRSVANESVAVLSPQLRQWHRLTTAAVKAVLAGRAPTEFPPLDLARGTKFQRSVWGAMRKIKLGQTQSYGEIAAAIGNPRAVRAVGGACGANPIPLLVPCHRVLAANQKIGGFSGGLEWKRKLLARENVNIS